MGLSYLNSKPQSGSDGPWYNSAIVIGGLYETDPNDPSGTTITCNTIHDNYWGLQHDSRRDNDVIAENNWWGHASGPEDISGSTECSYASGTWTCGDLNADGSGDKVSDNVDYCPWSLAPATLWLEIANPGWLAECEDKTIIVNVMMSANNFNGVEFDLDFVYTLLQVVDAVPGGVIQISMGSMWPGTATDVQNTVDNSTGIINFAAYLHDADTEMSVCGGQVAQIEFSELNIAGTSSLDLNDVIVSNLEGVAIEPVDLQDGSLEVKGCGCVHGIVEVQGRSGPDWDGAEVTLSGGPGGGYGPETSASDGSWQICAVVEGDYDVAVEMARYLDGLKTGVSIVDSGNTDTGQVKVLGGDANDTTDGTTHNPALGTSDYIDINDASILATDFGKTTSFDVRADINDDSKVNILDCSLLGGNWHKSSPVNWQ
jgi:hypothetical protein